MPGGCSDDPMRRLSRAIYSRPCPGPSTVSSPTCRTSRKKRLSELEPEVAEHEPRIALTPGTRGTELILRLITQLPSRLHPNGVAVLEVDPGQESAIADAARQMLPNANITILDDVSQRPRAVRIIAG